MTSEQGGASGPADRAGAGAPWLGDVHDGVAAWTRGREAVATDDGEAPAASGSGRGPGRGRGRGRTGGDGGARRPRQPRPDDEAAAVPPADPEAVARKILLDQLTGQARTRQELADRLAKKLVPDEIASALLDRFTEVGLIDDEAFARAWIASRQPGKGLARRALAQELRRKGVDDEIARDALAEIDPDDEESAARGLVRRKLRSLARVDDTVATRRLVGMLARKGYPPGLAYRVVRDELDASGREAPEQPTDGGLG